MSSRSLWRDYSSKKQKTRDNENRIISRLVAKILRKRSSLIEKGLAFIRYHRNSRVARIMRED